jgi:hypothetical protein
MTGSCSQRMCRPAVLLVGLAVSACASRDGAFGLQEGPYLAPGPLPGTAAGDLLATPALPPQPASRPATAATPSPSPSPAGLTAAEGAGLLRGATMPGVGPVHGLVIPVSLGPRLPLRDDAALVRDYFGPGAALVEQMSALSGGLFRPTFTVLPTLVDSRTVLRRDASPRELMDFARAALRSAAERTELSAYDNDGPDGIASSPDDDRRLDFVVLVLESDEPFPSVTLRQEFTVPTRSGSVSTGPIHILSLPRSEAADVRPAVGLWLDALGLDPGERFFPPEMPRGVSSLARVRLGWIAVDPLTTAGRTTVSETRAALVPLQDLGAGAGFWLIERERDHLYVSRVARKADGHYASTESHLLRRGEGQVLPLTRQFGERGPRVLLRWPDGAADPELEVLHDGPGRAG